MAKVKTLQKRKAFSFDNMAITKVKDDSQFEQYSPTERLRDVKFTVAALAEAMLDGDEKAIKEIIKNHFEAINVAQVLKIARISKRTFYEAVSDKGNPSLHTLTQIVHAMRLGQC